MTSGDLEDPDVAFGILMNKGVCPSVIYDDDDVRVARLLEDVYEIISDGTDAGLEIGVTAVLEEYPRGTELEVWETTRINDYKVATTVVLTEENA